MKDHSFHLMLTTAIVAVSLTVVSAPAAVAQNSPSASPKPAAASPASLPDQEIGRRITVKGEDLPPPGTKPIAASRSMTLPYTGQVPHVPDGFTATAFATNLEHPRRLLVLPNGDVLVAEQKVG